jgi:hypothetical protein
LDAFLNIFNFLQATNLHEKSVYVQLKDSPDEKIVIDMNQFVSDLRNDICLQEVENIEECIQILYIISECDYISYFRGLWSSLATIYFAEELPNAHLAWPLNSLSNPPAVTKKHSNLGNFKFLISGLLGPIICLIPQKFT